MINWEYITYQRTKDADDSLDDMLCSFGANGWELVSVVNNLHYFKRPIK